MKLYGICYGIDFIYGTYGSAFSQTPHPQKPVDAFSFFYYLAKWDTKNILIDTGFQDKKLAEDMGVQLLPIKDELTNICPQGLPAIDAVILTHSHWDHIGNIPAFPDADIFLVPETYHLAMQDDNEAVKERLSFSNVHIVTPPCRIYDKFELVHVGGHTSDSCAVLFIENGLNYVITGDECYLCDNLEKTLPIGITVSEEKNLAFLKKMKEESRIPLPFHDGSLLTKYRKLSEHIVEII